MSAAVEPRVASRFEVSGRVQGVGFRPFVRALALEEGLAGWVRNRAGVVEIHVEGDAAAIDRFASGLPARAPALARIRAVRRDDAEPGGADGFSILASRDDAGPPVLAPDTATCDACLRELLDPADRHYGYPLLSCTACGPRLTIVEGAPWDRERTTMAPFPMCAACRAAYGDPADRRFHAQPIACPACGPPLVGDAGVTGPAALESFARALADGRIGALKGIGGFHLACDARDARAVEALRARKGRPHEPFAVMVGDLDAARTHVRLSEREAAALLDPMRPVVLCRVRDDADVASAVAPGLAHLGVVLPYSGLHHLLARALPGVPLVLTSANAHGAPMLHTVADEARLHALADTVLTHRRAIALRCDDSVVRCRDGALLPLRLGRGAAPLSLPLPGQLAEPTVALGGHVKATFALGRGDEAVLGPHVGDLDDLEAERGYEALLDRLTALLRIAPRRAVIDAHPDYATRRVARRRAAELLEVHHHHAHLASCMAEHGLEGEVLGVIFDGAGLGPDGTIWGGEILAGGYASVARVAHLRPVPLAGGERAILEPWRVVLAYLRDAGIDPTPRLAEIPRAHRDTVEAMIARGLRSPLTSSAGRLFDAAAYLAGLVRAPSFEAHGPMWLEAAAARVAATEEGYPMGFEARADGPAEIDPRPLLGALLADVDAGIDAPKIAARFHGGLAAGTARALVHAAERTGLERVVLSGGVFANAIFAEALARAARAAGLAVLEHRRVPPSDGGLAYGQLAICAARDAVR